MNKRLCNRRSTVFRSLLLSALVLLIGSRAGAALVSQFTFQNDTIGGTTVNDDGPGGNPGTLQGNAAIVDDESLRGNVLLLDGSGDYSRHPDSPSLDISGSSLSLTGWVYKTDTNDGTLVGKELDSSQAWGLEANPGHVRFFIWGNGGNGNLDNVSGLSNDTWHHVAGTYDGSNMRVYIDGVESGSLSFNRTITTNNDPLGIGYSKISGNSDNYLAGKVDDVGIYNSALSAEEVAIVHGLGKFAGVDQADPAVADTWAAFQAGPGSTIEVDGEQWRYSGGLPGPKGSAGGDVDGGNAYIVLDGAGNGLQTTTHYARNVLDSSPLEYYQFDTLGGRQGDTLVQNGVDIDQRMPAPSLDEAGGFHGMQANNSWANFDGSGGATLTDVITDWDSEAGSASYWVRLDGDGNGIQTGLMGKPTGVTGDFDASGNFIGTFQRTNGSYGVRVGTTTLSSDNGAMNMDQWHMLTFTWDRASGSGDGQIHAYLDGNRWASINGGTWDQFTVNDAARFGKEINEGGGNSRRLKGSADELAIYGRVLAQDEIRGQYEAAVRDPEALTLVRYHDGTATTAPVATSPWIDADPMAYDSSEGFRVSWGDAGDSPDGYLAGSAPGSQWRLFRANGIDDSLSSADDYAAFSFTVSPQVPILDLSMLAFDWAGAANQDGGGIRGAYEVFVDVNGSGFDSVGGRSTLLPLVPSDERRTWSPVMTEFVDLSDLDTLTAGDSVEFRIALADNSGANGKGIFLQGIHLTGVIPEPSSALLAVVGLLALLTTLRGSRRRATAA